MATPVTLVDKNGFAVGDSGSPSYTRPAPSGAAQISGNFTVAVATVAAAYASGTTAATGISAAFAAIPGFDVWLSLFPNGWPATSAMSGTFIAMRSTDGGTTWLPFSVGGTAWNQFSPTAPVNEVLGSEGDAGVLYRIACTVAPSAQINFTLGHK